MRFRWRVRLYNGFRFGNCSRWIVRRSLLWFWIFNIFFKEVNKEIHHFRSFFLLMDELPVIRANKIIVIGHSLWRLLLCKKLVEIFGRRRLNFAPKKNLFHDLPRIKMIFYLVVNLVKLSLLLDNLCVKWSVFAFEMTQIFWFDRFSNLWRQVKLCIVWL